MESDPYYSAYNAGLINVRVTAPHVYRHHLICGLLRVTRVTGWVYTNILGPSSPTVTRVWRYYFADGRIDYATGQMDNLFGAPKRWPYGLDLRPVATQAVIYT